MYDTKTGARVNTWRDEVIGKLAASASRLTLAADPDELLLEERLLQRIEELGFRLITFRDHIEFRFAFESRYRSRQDEDRDGPRGILVRVSASDPNVLPFDLLARGRRVSLSLGELFPKLSYPVVASLDRADLDDLFAAQLSNPPGQPLGDRDTRSYVLRHAFRVAPEAIASEEDLLRFLLRRHYRRLRVPAALDVHLAESLARTSRFREWPLARIIPDREAFFAFLQERWPHFLDRMTAPSTVREDPPPARSEVQIPGPVRVAFDHDDVRVYIDNLFLEGVLKPVPHAKSERLAGSWVMVGVSTDPAADRARRMRALLRTVEETVPAEGAGHRDWLALASRWAELGVLQDDLSHDGTDPSLTERYQALRERIDEGFAAWLATRYSTLHNHPPVPPVMLHHVPKLLARRAARTPDHKVALVLVDGLALDQWVTVREVLASQLPGLRFRESSVFAWIPTLTSVSRQACFAGRPPFYFGSGISSTAGEPAAWRRFWVEEGMASGAVRFQKKLRDDDDVAGVADAVSEPAVRVVALVVDVVDQIMHGVVLGSGGMRNQVEYWARGGTLAKLLDVLLNRGFSVFLTSDHGNVETRGCGRPREGVLVETYGKRVRVYDDAVLRDRVHREFPKAIPWPSIGLPEHYYPLIAPARSSFVREGERPVAHGGASLEEVVVPLVEIEAP